MVLHKRVVRNFKDNASFYISSILLTFFAVWFVVIMYAAVDVICADFNKIMKECNLEDAQFKTLSEISDDDIKTIEEKFDVELEEISYVDCEDEEYVLRIFAITDNINTYKLIDGKRISEDNEALLNPDFMTAHNINIGDTISIVGNEFIVKGSCVRPDYLYAQKETTDFYVDDNTFGQVTVTKEGFSKFEHTQNYYSIVYSKDNSVEVRKYINDNYYALSYLDAYVNNRINIARDMISEYEIIVDSIAPIMFLMIAVIVAVVLGRMVKKDQKRIGTLVAMGYRKAELVFHYSLYALCPGIIGSVLGIIFSITTLKPMCLLFAMDFETIDYKISLPAKSVVISLLMPAAFYCITAIFVIMRMLKNNTAALLSNNIGKSDKRKKELFVKSNMNFKYKFQLRNILMNKSRSLVALLGLIVGSCVCLFGFIFMDSCKEIVDKGLVDVGSFEYQYYLNTIIDTKIDGGETILSGTFEVPGSRSLISINGVEKKSEYLNMVTTDGEDIKYGEYYITTNAAARYKVNKGDSFTFANILTLEEQTIVIKGIIEDNTQNVIYTSKANASKLLGLSKESYNIIISDKAIEMLDKDKIATTITKDSMREQLERAVAILYGMIYAMIFFGSIICIVVVYLIVNMLVEENKTNISMLKVLGYRNKEINRLILDTNHLLVPIAYVLSIWACLAMCKAMFQAFVEELNLYIAPIITPLSIIICLIIVIASYFISLLMLKKKVYKVDMVESLKDNRE